jgi:hypothetical protein
VGKNNEEKTSFKSTTKNEKRGGERNNFGKKKRGTLGDEQKINKGKTTKGRD